MVARSVVVRLLLMITVSQPLFGSQTQDQTAALIADARSFVELLTTKNFAAAVTKFNDTMKAALPEAKLQETWNAVLAQAGAFKQASKTRSEKHGAYTVVFVTCDFQNTSLDIRVAFDESRRVGGLFFVPATKAEYSPPAYARTDSFREKETTVGTGEWALPATLTPPVGNGPFPAVVLVHGSGPNDREETIGPNKPFKDLAWGLASNGIAVLRYEKRTRQHSAKMVSLAKFTVKEEVIDDVLAAVELLRKTEGVDAKRIFVLGHSLGGMLVPRIAQLDPNIAGLIALAGSTRPLEDVIPEQLAYIFSLDGSVSPEEQKQLDQTKEQLAKVKTLKPEDATSATPIFGAPPAYWLDLRGYDPPEVARGLKQPLLILQGERDYQVTMEDFRRWSGALAKNSNVTLKSYPQLNHLFIAGTGPGKPSEYEQPGHVDERVIQDIAQWVKKQVGQPEKRVHVLGQEFANAQIAEARRKQNGADGKSPMPAGEYDFWRGETSLINPTKLPLDSELSALSARFAGSDKKTQANMRLSISMDEFYTLLTFSRRSAVFAMRERDVKWVRNGLTAVAMIEAERVDFRDILMALSLLYHSGKRVGSDPNKLFRDVARIAEPNVAELLTSYVGRPGGHQNIRTAFGHDEIETAGGLGFIGWGGDEYRPTYDLKKIVVDLAAVIDKDQYQTSVQVAVDLPPVWLEAPANPSLKSVLKKVRAGASVHGKLRTNPPTPFGQTLMLFLVETKDSSAAQELLEMSRRKPYKDDAVLAIAEGKLFCLLIGRSVELGAANIETSERLQRFSPAFTEILKKAELLRTQARNDIRPTVR